MSISFLAYSYRNALPGSSSSPLARRSSAVPLAAPVWAAHVPSVIHGARARGDRTSITETDGVNGRLLLSAQSTPRLAPLNVFPASGQDRAPLVSVIAARSVVISEPFIKECLSTKRNRGDNRTEVPCDGGALVVVAGTKPNLHEATVVTRTVRDNPRLALIPRLMPTSMEMYPMSNVISLAQRMAARVDARAEAYRLRALADNFMDETETETYRDWKSTAREFEQYADLMDSLESLRHSGFTPRNIRRLRDYVSLDDSIA